MFKVGICPHELEGKTLAWQNFVQALSQSLGLPLYLEAIKDFAEERKKIEEEDFLLYYASTFTSTLLYQKGYEPLASFKDQRDYFLWIGTKPLKDLLKRNLLKVSLVENSFFILSLLQFSQKFNFDFSKFEFVWTEFYKEVLEKVLSQEIDLGVIHKEHFFKLEKEKTEKVEIYGEFTLDTSHLFMVSSQFELKEELKKALLSLDKKILEDLGYEALEPILESQVKNIENLFLFNQLVLELLKEKKIAEALLKSPYFGVLIYHQRYLYANPYACNLFGYSMEEFLQLKPEDIFYFEEDKELARSIIRRRLKGEFFTQIYDEKVLKTKKGKKIYALVYSNTIFYEEKYCGLVIIIDVTKKKRLERVYQILKLTNQILVEARSEEELFKRLGEVLVNTLKMKMVWIGTPDHQKREIKPFLFFNEEGEDDFKTLKISVREDEPEGQGSIGVAFRKNEIAIIPELALDPRFIPCREEALRKGYNSVAIIPIFLEKEVSYLMILYAEEPYFFEEEVREVLEELKRDLEFGLTKLAEWKLQLLLAEALKRFSEFLIVVNKEGKILTANERACELVKMSLNDLIGEPLSRFGFLIEDKNLEEFIKKGFLKETQKIPVKWISYEGHESWFEFDITRVKLSEEKEAYILTGETILRLVEFYEELKKAQAYDSLTGLLNYNGFVKAFSEKLSEVKRGLLILLDIYNFSYINHTYGFEYGDLCLKEVAHHFYREDFILSRIGSDNFAILKPFKEEEEAKKVIRWLQKKMKEPLWITVRTGLLTLSYHAAVVRFPEDGQNFETLWNRANLTLSKAKKKDPNTIEFFNPIYAEEVSHYLTKESLVKRALRENLFTFYYQPYFDLSNLKLVGLEALVRIKEKDGTLYLPLEFIEILEKCPYLQDFFKWSLREIEKKIFKWKIPISLNVSVNTLKMEENFNEIVTLVTSIKNKVGLDLDLEITERDFAENVAFMEKRISQLKASGVKIFLDDFGTGYSSLIYLKEFPLDVIKIDRIFIKDMLQGKKEMGLVKTAIDLAHTLGMKALAEGVETEEQLKILDIMGCDYVQGFYLAPPLPEEEVETFLKRQGLL